MNLRDRDNLRAKDKRPVPKVSFIQRFDCNIIVVVLIAYGHGIDNKGLNVFSLRTYKPDVAASISGNVDARAHRKTTVPHMHEPRIKINLNLAALSTFISEF